ncbi:zinc finger protein 532 isoform X1 [Dasypus novemcinctus]|uniref:zinc finger protein 532 isoform X1 n=1 Tax=Dasypus novemcinctus TaxID=9361 RepID=UPI00265EE53F|nr:zinc finger protein 532 isoform X1 [Dasypus novemcinctus]XP_058133790.1 zinc finger protein 532 isoform X1 [Dasypus novemcinctus]XP_058133791.1 zinc finger protein 532 isoform X1 [Dasypus novemcinctus]XP_058133792.1 zinc finger protein 532 isoform X1 [Dasypus novemcinctus]XP_058133793.1 zinc finger protein 532 isoform X1 [Dasypus novemcinctus]XP_058133794.1 zinc finger protein 532 isoform X1 [Dasypus novemcinctus]XP_058133795.1 zinc finger protein 532 isoform X1 [Dasypus novemcinctus]XP_0
MTMGDMKTPDFDDLLAAFDIPDMVDPKAAIESGHDDHESHIKQNAHVEDDSHTPSSSDVGVSVIVKNVRNLDSSEGVEKDGHNPTGNGLHNGFLTASSLDSYSKDGAKSLKGDVPTSEVTLKDSTFSQFSPISSAEEFDDDEKIEVDDPPDKEEMRSNFRSNVLTGSVSQQDYDKLKALGGENLSKTGISALGNLDKNKVVKRETETNSINLSVYEPFKVRKVEDKLKENSEKVLENRVLDGKLSSEKNDTNLVSVAQAKTKSSSKLSSCIAAIAALSAKKAASDSCREPVTNSRESSPLPKEVNDSPRAVEKSPESQSLIDGAKKASVKQPDSPRSVSSENSSKGSPSSPAGSTPAIPKVRIKTIKTSSGEIKRTVTRVLPEVELDSGKKPSEQAASVMASVTSLLSSPTSAAVLSSPPRAPLQSAVVTNAVSPAELTPKQVTIKPVATAFLPVSAVKTAGSQVINLKLANNTTVKATVISAASVQSASSAIIKAANAIQQQTVVVPASSLANAKLVPKTVHLANLNLLPQGAQATSELRQVLTKPQQQIKQAIINAAASQPPKKVSRVQVVSSLQSSVVEAFNKVLSSVNPVPVYIPNLSPPANAGITLPTRGYKCLECGDSFALEKSLTQHYDRRSVRIEVTCNHCTKNLVFYNKCSLLSHARGHKEKGVVMQCSHLILKPVPADQMIVSSSGNTSASSSTLQSSAGAGTHTVTKIQSGITGTVISAPSSTPIIPAMPLDEDPSKLCRHSLKCLECNEVFQDETSLATHFQQAADTSGQKTCTICQMLLPNQCSFASHQRIHQHKSPYTCPECGAICRSVHFQTHVTKNCLHYTRRVGFRCVHCNVVYSDVAALKSHIQGSHCEVFYKCPICPMAFKSAPSTHSHAYTQHPGIKIGEPKIIYKCSMCDTVFTLQTLLYRHFDQHIENQKVSVFKCPDCSLLYAQKQLMMDHIKSMHGTLKSIEGPPNLGINLPLSIKPATQNSANQNKEDTKSMNGKEKLEKKSPSPVKKSVEPKKVASPGWTCWECDRLFTQRDVYISHVRKEHGKITLLPPLHNNSQAATLLTPTSTSKLQVFFKQMKKHPCRQCDKSFSSSHSLCRHNRIKHKGIRKVYTCSHCPDSRRTFTKRLMLEKHIQLMHGIKDPDLKEMTEATNEEETEIKEDAKVPSPKRKLEEPVLEFRPPRGAITQPLKKLKINVFKVHKCAVCGFTTENLLQFHEHIPQHKSDGSSYQCRECGLCYTSHVSLSRHLFIVHKLKEPQPVSKQNGAGEDSQQENKPSPEDEAPDGAVSDRKCKVCAKTFETEAALNTHMRTHGMAFIKSKRMSSAEK